MTSNRPKRPLAMIFRILRVLIFKPDITAKLVTQSYDRISSDYDHAWTSHMRGRSEAMVELLPIKVDDKVLDLTCGTGYITQLLSTKTKARTIGVDRSEGMIRQAIDNYKDRCDFTVSDILDYLRKMPPNSFDAITCGWGLGYSRPLAVLREVRRILKPGGYIGIIDNSLFSLAGVLWCSVLAFMEQPSQLNHIMRFRFLIKGWHLGLWLRLAGLKPVKLWDGNKSYYVNSGAEAIDRLQRTGAAAGFEYAAGDNDNKLIFERFGKIIEDKFMNNGQITVTHRYLGGIASK